MNVELRHNPGFSIARCTLAGGEQMKAESGAMAATSGGVVVEAKMQGGLMKGLKRSVLGGESFFMTTLTAPNEGGWVDVAARLPGDAVVLQSGAGLNLTKGCYLASTADVEIDTKWGGFKNIGGGEGGFLIRATGGGTVVASAYGAIDQVVLPAGETIIVDSGHLVAFEDGIDFTTHKASSGVMNTLKSGEGFVMNFTGPGTIYTQTRNPDALVTWLTQVLPFSRS